MPLTMVQTFAEYLSAGFPSAAEGYEDIPLNFHDLLVRNPAATYYYRVDGNDLENEHVCNGAIIVVDRSRTAKLGKLVLIEEDGISIVRRFETSVKPMLVIGVVVAAVMRF